MTDNAPSLSEPVLFVHVLTSHDRQDDPWLVSLMLPSGEVVLLEERDPDQHDAHLAALEARIEAALPARVVSWSHFTRIVLRRAYRRVGRPLPGWFDDAWGLAQRWVPDPQARLDDAARAHGYTPRVPGLDDRTADKAYAAWRDRGTPFSGEPARAQATEVVRALAHVVDVLRGPDPDSHLVERAVDLVALHEGSTTEDLAAQLDVPHPALQALLTELEGYGFVASHGREQRCWYLR